MIQRLWTITRKKFLSYIFSNQLNDLVMSVAKIISMQQMTSNQIAEHESLKITLKVYISILLGEFDPGSERTLVACLIHASRTRKHFGVSTVAHG